LSRVGGGSTATAGLGLLGGLSGGFAAPRQDVGNKIKVTPHINESNQVRLEIDQESSAPGATSGTLGAVSITKRTANTTVVVQDEQTVVIGGLMSDSYTTTRTKVPVLGDLPLLGALFRTSDVEKSKKNLLLVLTPHVIRDQDDLRKIFERKIQERQEFLDRYFVFSGEDWKPPHDWSRTNGLVEDIRKAYAEIAEQQVLEDQSKPKETPPREPSDPIELPGDSPPGASSGANGTPPAAEAPRRRNRPAGGAAAPAPPAAPPAQPQGDNEPSFRINPIARSVNVDRVE
jgi:general secretion pathway protein D